MSQNSIRVLFTGYAPVHFVCFLPLYERMMHTPGIEAFVAGGLREKTENGPIFHSLAMYRPFGIPAKRILTMEEMKSSDFDLLFAANTKMLEPRSVGAKVQIFHGVSFRNRAIRKENLGADYFFMAGPYMERRFVEAGLLQEGDRRALPIGFMKTDRLVDGSLDRRTLLASHGFDGSRPVLLYAPTGQKHCSLDLMGVEFIERVKATGRYDLLIKLHDHPHDVTVDWPARLAELEDDHTRLADSFDVIPLLYLSDLLVTDASSVSSEYALLDRPMVFLDVPKLLAKAAAKEGSMMDENTWGRRVGTVCPTADAAVEAIQHSLANPDEHSEIRRSMAADLFYNPGTATQAALEWLQSSFAPLKSIT